MKVFTGLAVLLVLVAASLGAHLQLRAQPPECPEAVPGVVLNLTFYPNEDDCNKYWECDQGNLYNGSCSEGLVWNPNLDSCDWPYNYDCPYDNKGAKPLSLSVRDVYQWRTQPPECPEAVPGVVLNLTFYPNEDDCNKYWECDQGNLYNGSCSEGLVWNPNLDSCDWPYNYDCPYDKKEAKPLSLSVSDIYQWRTLPPECPEAVPGVVLNLTFYPNEDDCNKYWECDQGNLYNGSCSEGLVWNPNLDSCDWPYNYDCPYDKTMAVLLPNQAILCPQPSPGEQVNVTFYPDEKDCTKYYECVNGDLVNGSCPDNLIWNPNIDTCDWPYNYECPYNKMKPISKVVGFRCPQVNSNKVGVIMFYPNEEDIQKYWECRNGEVRERKCESDNVWDPSLKKCVSEFN